MSKESYNPHLGRCVVCGKTNCTRPNCIEKIIEKQKTLVHGRARKVKKKVNRNYI